MLSIMRHKHAKLSQPQGNASRIARLFLGVDNNQPQPTLNQGG